MKKVKRFGGGGRSAYQGNEDSYTQESDPDAADSVDKGAMSRRLQAANSSTQEERDAVSNLKISTEPKIGPVKEYPKGRDFDAVDTAPSMDDMEAANQRENLAPVGPRAMPTRPGQNVSGVMPVKKSAAQVVASEAPAGNPKLNSLRGHKPQNFDPALRSSESVGNSQSATLNKQLQKAPTENAGRMAARQALEKKAANTAANQAIIDRMKGRKKPYMKDEAGNDMKRGGSVKKMASGGMTASRRADGIAQRGKTRGKMY